MTSTFLFSRENWMIGVFVQHVACLILYQLCSIHKQNNMRCRERRKFHHKLPSQLAIMVVWISNEKSFFFSRHNYPFELPFKKKITKRLPSNINDHLVPNAEVISLLLFSFLCASIDTKQQLSALWITLIRKVCLQKKKLSHIHVYSKALLKVNLYKWI